MRVYKPMRERPIDARDIHLTEQLTKLTQLFCHDEDTRDVALVCARGVCEAIEQMPRDMQVAALLDIVEFMARDIGLMVEVDTFDED